MAIARRKSTALAAALKQADHGRLLPPMERFLASRPSEHRRADILHPSYLSKREYCVRSSYLGITQNRLAKDKVGFQLQRIFDEGHLIHAKYQRYLREMGVLYGRWRCGNCDNLFTALSPTWCSHCQSEKYIEYREVPMEVPRWLLAGHADGWTKGIGDDCLIEIKSVGTGTVRVENPTLFDRYEGNLDEIWKNLRRPFPSHINQGQLYLSMLHEMDSETAPKEVVFIYECKLNQSAKEFVVPYMRSHVQPIIDFAIEVKRAVDLGKEPTCEKGCRHCKAYE